MRELLPEGAQLVLAQMLSQNMMLLFVGDEIQSMLKMYVFRIFLFFFAVGHDALELYMCNEMSRK